MRACLVLCATAVAVLVISCGRVDLGSQSERLLLEPGRLAETERLHYRILLAGLELGTRLQVTDTTTLNVTVPAFSVMTVDRIRLGNIEQTDSTIVQMRRDSLIPIATFRFRRKGPLMVTAAALFRQGGAAGAGGSVGITTYEPGTGESYRVLPFGTGGSGCGERSLLSWLGKAMVLPAGQEAGLTCAWVLSEPPGGAVVQVNVAADREEVVSVPAGSFECRQLRFVIAGTETLRCWYSIGDRSRLVKSRSSSGEELELLGEQRESASGQQARLRQGLCRGGLIS